MSLKGNRAGKVSQYLYILECNDDGVFFAIEMGNGDWYIHWVKDFVESDPCRGAHYVYDAPRLMGCRRWFTENRAVAERRKRKWQNQKA